MTETLSDVVRRKPRPLDAIFHPSTVAVVGATEKEGSVGRTVLWNLISTSFGGTVFPVNPKRPNVLGIKAYPNLAAVPDELDLVVVVTPATTVPGIITQCVEVGARGVIVISAGFKEIGPEGSELERQVLAEARRGQIRIIGPNCLGLMNPLTGLNATFATTLARPGKVGFISQSGALCTGILDWSLHENVGFSAFVSIGSMLDVGWGDLIYHLGNDRNTESIVIYMETIGDPRAFLSAAREVGWSKPIIVIKPGRTEDAARAASSHTGSLTGSDEVLEAAFRRCGVLRVNSIAELFYMAEVLAKQPRPKGPRLTIVTNAGGPGVLATDALITNGGELTELSQETFNALDEFLPGPWSRNNPIDILGDASPERYASAVEVVARDPGSDGLLVVLTPQAMTDPTQTAEQLRPYAQSTDKPVLASWMGGADVAAGAAILNQANIPTFPYPDTAARVFNYMWRYSYNLAGLHESSMLPPDSRDFIPDRSKANSIVEHARESGRTLLTEAESKQLLAAYGIPTVETRVATIPDDAVKHAEDIGYPVVLKLHSETLTHKTDVGGVQLNLVDADAVRGAFGRIEYTVREKAGAEHFLGVTVQPMIRVDGYEIIIGSSLDPQFGPVLLFGTGGQLVEVFKDRALALPPLTSALARRLMEQTKIYAALKGVRGREAINLAALEELLVRFSRLSVEQEWIAEMDINPLLASPKRLVALDARVVLHDKATAAEQLPEMAIRPYPIQYVSKWKAKNGSEITIRPIRPEDEELMVKFHGTLSDRSVYYRYLSAMHLNKRVAHDRLIRMCFIDYDRQMALVADHKDPLTGEHEILGVGRLTKLQGTNDAELGLLVTDSWQGGGLGTELLRRVLDVGRCEKIHRIIAEFQPENRAVRRVCEKLGFRLRSEAVDALLEAVIDLSDTPPGNS
jgi:acetyltransferase